MYYVSYVYVCDRRRVTCWRNSTVRWDNSTGSFGPSSFLLDSELHSWTDERFEKGKTCQITWNQTKWETQSQVENEIFMPTWSQRNGEKKKCLGKFWGSSPFFSANRNEICSRSREGWKSREVLVSGTATFNRNKISGWLRETKCLGVGITAIAKSLLSSNVNRIKFLRRIVNSRTHQESRGGGETEREG